MLCLVNYGMLDTIDSKSHMTITRINIATLQWVNGAASGVAWHASCWFPQFAMM